MCAFVHSHNQLFINLNKENQVTASTETIHRTFRTMFDYVSRISSKILHNGPNFELSSRCLEKWSNMACRVCYITVFLCVRFILMRSSLSHIMSAKTKPIDNSTLQGIHQVCCLFSTDQRQKHVTKTAGHLHRHLPRQWLQVSWRFHSTSCESLPGYTALSSFDSSSRSQFPEAPLFGHSIFQVDSTTKNSTIHLWWRPLSNVFKRRTEEALRVTPTFFGLSAVWTFSAEIGGLYQ